MTPFALPVGADWRWRLAAAWRRAAERAPQSATRRALDRLVDLGLVSSVRDLGRLQQALTDAGLFAGAGRPLALAESERARTVARINAVIDRSLSCAWSRAVSAARPGECASRPQAAARCAWAMQSCASVRMWPRAISVSSSALGTEPLARHSPSRVKNSRSWAGSG